MECQYSVEVNYELQITHEEFAIIWRNASTHYSNDVKGETKQGIFNGMKNRMEWHLRDLKKDGETPLPIHPISFRKFQLIMKALEMDEADVETWQLMCALKKAFELKQERQKLADNYMNGLNQQIF